MGVLEAQRGQERVTGRPQVQRLVAETRQGARGPTPRRGLPTHTSWACGPVFRAAVNPQPSTVD